MQLRLLSFGLALFCGVAISQVGEAKVTFSPFYSISGTKAIKPDKANSGKENVTNRQRQTYGLNAGISFWKVFGAQFSIGQSQLTLTQKTQDAVDDFGDIDYERDLNMDTSNGDSDVKTVETMNKARLGIVLDPSFWILIMRAKAGVQATQRIMELEQAGLEPQKHEEPITYKPYAGVGAGVRLSRRMFVMAEYSFYFYKFPEYEPFEREVQVSFGVSI